MGRGGFPRGMAPPPLGSLRVESLLAPLDLGHPREPAAQGFLFAAGAYAGFEHRVHWHAPAL